MVTDEGSIFHGRAVHEQLSFLPGSGRGIFALLCAVRMRPCAARYSAVVDPLIGARFDEALDLGWLVALEKVSDAIEVEEQIATIDELIPDEDSPWFTELPYGSNSLACLCYALETVVNGQVQTAAYAAQQLGEVADYAAGLAYKQDRVFTVELEHRIAESPLVRGAESAVRADLQAAAHDHVDRVALRELAAREADRWARYFP